MDVKRYPRFTREGHAVTGDRSKTYAEKRDALGHDYFPHWLRHYNERRPHSSLGGQPPISRAHNLPGQDSWGRLGLERCDGGHDVGQLVVRHRREERKRADLLGESLGDRQRARAEVEVCVGPGPVDRERIVHRA